MRSQYTGRLIRHKANLRSNLVANRLHTFDWQVPTRVRRVKDTEYVLLNKIGKKLGIKQLDDWYGVELAAIARCGGGHIIKRHGHSLQNSLESLYPGHHWLPWRFNHVRVALDGVSLSKQRKYFQRLGRTLGIKELDEWYQLTNDTIEAHGGGGIVQEYNGSISLYLKAMYPHHNWQPWRFSRAPVGYWDKKSNQLEALDYVGQQLDVYTQDKWRSISPQHVIDHGLHSLLLKYNGSLSATVCSVFSQAEPRAPRLSWTEKAQLHFVRSAARKFNITNATDWYHVSAFQLLGVGAKGFVQYYPQALSLVYPEYNWDWQRFKVGRSTQRLLKGAVTRCLTPSNA